MIYGIFGAGGFGREVMPIARDMLALGNQGSIGHELVFVVEGLETEYLANGHRVISDETFIGMKAPKAFNVAIANSQARQRIAERMLAIGVNPFTIRAYSAIVLDENEIGEGAILCDRSIITSNARIGKFFHSNLGSYIAHDCVVGDYVTCAPNVCCNGRPSAGIPARNILHIVA